MQQLINALNDTNNQLTEIQKTVVSTLLALQKGQLNLDNNNAELLRQPFETAIPSLRLILLNIRQRVMLITAAAAEQAQPQSSGPTPSVTDVQSLYKDVSKELRPQLEELVDATSQPTAPMSPARQRIADIAAGMAHTMLGEKLGPDFVRGVQEHRAAQAQAAEQPSMPTLKGVAPEPVKVQPTAEELKRQADEATHQNLIEMICGSNGLFAVWFSGAVYQAGKGPLVATPGVNLYEQDISRLSYERLVEWPEGFYLNAGTSAFQFLVKTGDVIGVIDFGNLVSDQVSMRQLALQLMFHSDNTLPKRKIPFTHLENDLLVKVIKDINVRLSNIHKQVK